MHSTTKYFWLVSSLSYFLIFILKNILSKNTMIKSNKTIKILVKNEQKKKQKKNSSSHYSVVGALSVNIYTLIYIVEVGVSGKNINN